MKTTMHGPGGIKLILDKSEVFPDDPGAGCPALVEYKGGTASLNCAEGEGCVLTNHGEIPLTKAQLAWLASDKVQQAAEAIWN